MSSSVSYIFPVAQLELNDFALDIHRQFDGSTEEQMME